MASEPNDIDPGSGEADEVRREFGDQVNMTAKELERWLETDESRAAGEGEGESTGHASGRRIVKVLGKNKDELTGSDLAHMKKVNGYIARHLKQRPDKSGEDLEETTWAHSLKNWGHDPTA